MRARNDLAGLLIGVILYAMLVAVCAARAQTAPPPIPSPFAPVAPMPRTEEAIDPLTVIDDDFARNRDPAAWAGLSARRISFVEQQASWRVFRIANDRKSRGPLWVILHDNENATFAAGLEALRSYGGVAMVVDTGPVDTGYAARFNGAVWGGAPIDPNRNFFEWLPVYAGTMLADLAGPGGETRPIIALHTNAYGFDSSLSNCPAPADAGSGEISVALCDAKHLPRPARSRRWPFDDDDTLALLPYSRGGDAFAGFCAKRLIARDFNIVFEAVGATDGSLSNYATYHGLRYINLETRERGSDPVGIAEARDRLVAMIDAVMAECVAIPAVALKPRR